MIFIINSINVEQHITDSRMLKQTCIPGKKSDLDVLSF